MKSGTIVEINGNTYKYSNRIGEDSNILESFNKLANDTFELSFSSVGGDYEPHVLLKDGVVCANVSVNQIPFFYQGVRKFIIQLGTVMTKPEYRNRGLSRWLLEHILAEWKGRCDSVYLFANDSVLEFYPKFGFKKMNEYAYQCQEITGCQQRAKQLDMEKTEHISLVERCYAKGNPFSALYMSENVTLLSFYCEGIMKDNVYYSEKYDVILIVKREEEAVWCYDIFGSAGAALPEVLGQIPDHIFEDAKAHICLGFTPDDKNALLCMEHKEEDCTLFVCGEAMEWFQAEKMMFPVISHA